MPFGFDTSESARADIYSCASRNLANVLSASITPYICYFWSYQQLATTDSGKFDGNIWLNVIEMDEPTFQAFSDMRPTEDPYVWLNNFSIPSTCEDSITVRNGVVTHSSEAPGCSAYKIVDDNIKVGANNGKTF